MARYYPKKITTSQCGLDVETCENVAASHGKKTPVPVLRVYGRVKNYVQETSQYGTFLRFLASDFIEAQSLITGDFYRAKQVILPPGAELVLQELIDAAKQADENATAEFGLDITVSFYQNQNKKGTAFTWGVKPLREPSGDDAISALGKSFGAPPLLSLSKPKGDKK